MATSKIQNYTIFDEVVCTTPTWDKSGELTQEWSINFPTPYTKTPKIVIPRVDGEWGVNALVTAIRSIKSDSFVLRITARDSDTRNNYNISGLKVFVYK